MKRVGWSLGCVVAAVAALAVPAAQQAPVGMNADGLLRAWGTYRCESAAHDGFMGR